eukprot:CAMPEP_0195646882 /NCGR_PEP_ID=MMETSP0815-20121206/29784_1 /TAXON_ID=97485 /ORGANISM="Prymnesium parvum, Strain Texoma1" /LENGTH=44 /DNA_ID= /DNA_START= /DNA_END= /DNA_ORIENTATION=
MMEEQRTDVGVVADVVDIEHVVGSDNVAWASGDGAEGADPLVPP